MLQTDYLRSIVFRIQCFIIIELINILISITVTHSAPTALQSGTYLPVFILLSQNHYRPVAS